MALQPVEAPGPVDQQTAKSIEEKTFLQQIKQVLPQGMPEALLRLNSANPTRQTIQRYVTFVSIK